MRKWSSAEHLQLLRDFATHGHRAGCWALIAGLPYWEARNRTGRQLDQRFHRQPVARSVAQGGRVLKMNARVHLEVSVALSKGYPAASSCSNTGIPPVQSGFTLERSSLSLLFSPLKSQAGS